MVLRFGSKLYSYILKVFGSEQAIPGVYFGKIHFWSCSYSLYSMRAREHVLKNETKVNYKLKLDNLAFYMILGLP